MTDEHAESDCARRIDAAPYVLGALADGERFEEHLATCWVCRAEIAVLQPIVDALPTAVEPASVPNGVRRATFATVRAEAELFAVAGPDADRAPRPTWRARRTRWAALATVAIALCGVAASILSTGESTRERVTDAQVISSQPHAHAQLRQLGGRAELVVSGLRQPPLGKIYEVWLSRGSGAPEATNALFSVTSTGSGSVDVPYSLNGIKEVMVTSEPLGGSERPTSAPVIRVALAS